MTTFDLGDGKQFIVGIGRAKIWAHGGGLGVDLTPEQQQEIGLTMWQLGRKAKRNANLQEHSDKL